MSDPLYSRDKPSALANKRYAPRIIAVSLVVIGALGVAALNRLPARHHAPVDPTSALRIEVFQPSEPKIESGERMEVGELVDGYRHVKARRWEPESEAYLDYADVWSEPHTVQRQTVIQVDRKDDRDLTPPMRMAPPRDDRDFGFADQQREFMAQREARRERRDRLDAARDYSRTYRERTPRYSDAEDADVQPELNPETSFY